MMNSNIAFTWMLSGVEGSDFIYCGIILLSFSVICT